MNHCGVGLIILEADVSAAETGKLVNHIIDERHYRL
jgi:hypothetical protein